jgi:O-antigen/teichoic acid export membrane protein
VGSSQLLVQGLSFLGGILIVRWLPSSEYALYTLANAMLATMSLLANSGISDGVMAESGKVWQDPKKLGAAIATGFSLRRRFAVGSIVIGGPILVCLLHSHGASWTKGGILFVGVAINFWFCALGSIYSVVPALHQRVSLIQRIAAIQGIARIFGLVLTVIAFPTALMALIPTAVAQAWASFRLRVATYRIVPSGLAEDPHVKSEVFKIVRRVLPNVIYMSLWSQLSIWLISICGDTDAVARLGALGRLGQLFVVFSTFAAVVFIPRFARLPAQKTLLLKRYWQTLMLIIAAGAACVGLVALFPQAALWILGNQYRGLVDEVILQAICSLIWFIVGIAYNLSASRGMVIRPEVNIPLQILAQGCLIALMNLNTVKGILWMSILLGAWQLAIYLADTTRHLSRMDRTSLTHNFG